MEYTLDHDLRAAALKQARQRARMTPEERLEAEKHLVRWVGDNVTRIAVEEGWSPAEALETFNRLLRLVLHPDAASQAIN